MSARRYKWLAVAAWLILLAHFYANDSDAFVLSLVLTPPLALLLLAAIRFRHTTLSLFLGFALLSHAVAPPFFFIRRESYRYSGGYGAVKDFGFQVGEFLLIYSYLFFLLAAITVFALALRYVLGFPRRRAPSEESPARSWSPSARRRANGLLLAAFIVFVATPCSLFMYEARVGISGLEAPVLPYRLTGILTYFRMFLVPLTIFLLYAGSNRPRSLAALILAYAALAGFASASRFAVGTIVAPVIAFAAIDRRKARLAVTMVAFAYLFLLVTESRIYVYSRGASFTLTELAATTVRGFDVSTFSPFELISGISNRLWGPQDVVLAYQYHVRDQLAAIFQYVQGRPVVADLSYEFYGMTMSGNAAAFGVGLGIIPWMLLLADRNLAVLLALAFLVACLIAASQRVVDSYAVFRSRLWRTAAQPIPLLLVYFIYASTLNYWTNAILLAAVPPLVAGVGRLMFSPRRRSPIAPPPRPIVPPRPLPSSD